MLDLELDKTFAALADPARRSMVERLVHGPASVSELAAPLPMSLAFGGGSAMAFRLGHRISYDADIFLRDPQILAYLSPRTNEFAHALAQDYQESANGLKLVTAHGDIDFIVGRDLTTTPSLTELIDGYNVACHTNAEILAKKIEFRGPSFTMRDMFDLAVLIARDPGSVDHALAA